MAEVTARRPTDLALATHDPEAPARLTLHLSPQTRFLVFGRGTEAGCFAALVRSAGYPVELHATDEDALAMAGFGRALAGDGWPEGLALDPQTAVTLFFHDHDREPALLQAALESPAFYVGAQGSLRAHLARCEGLRARGVAEEQIARLASPFGLIPSTRDPRTLAVSVLAHVLERAAAAG